MLLADDHRMVAEALKSLLAPEFELVGVVEDGRALVAAAKQLRPDVIVADITMPHLNGLDALPQLRKDNPSVKVVFLTMHKDVAYARRALESGGSGFVLKHSAPAELVDAIRAALDGKTYLTPALAGEVLQAMKRDPAEGQRSRRLAHAAAAGDSATAGRRSLGQGNRRRARHLGAHGGVPQVPDDGIARPARQRRAGALRHQARHRSDLNAACHAHPTCLWQVVARRVIVVKHLVNFQCQTP